MAAVFAHGALRLYLLALLKDGPRHGYEIIKALSDRFGGTYSPSAGTVYPRLAKLEAEGLVATGTEGRRTVYRLTEAGLAELTGRQAELAGIEQDISASVKRLADDLRADIRRNMQGVRADLAASAENVRHTAGPRHGDVLGDRALKELEHQINQFRTELRADLRRHAAGQDGNGGISEITAETIRTVLDQAKASIRATLGESNLKR
ncbi:PadR family transcriptional regulator [Arthrobacter castelli]|uniref:PadR family transcriptional regulator n=1 Tax=Arthrobacter castelli TaxID=271431 RepID=UPI0003FAC760|nr:PadR family transcriptional regulator [Arthrobacter castelli]